MILEKMRKAAEDACEDQCRQCVVTVPAYFDDNQKQATMEAIKIAGLECKTLLNEPTVAAIYYAFQESNTEAKKIMVFDFGGGTLDISIVAMSENYIKVKTFDGDYDLGGRDFDIALMHRFIEHFKEETGIDIGPKNP